MRRYNQKKKKSTVLVLTVIVAYLIIICGIPYSAKADRTSVSESLMSNASTYNSFYGGVAQDSYFTDDSGNILMFVNVLGKVAKQGQFVVRENADFSTILALSGGLQDGVNLTKVLVIRHEPDDNGQQAYIVNLKNYYKTGDKSCFINIKPNDTIIFPEKAITIAKIAQYASIMSPFVYFYDILERNY
jgi:hypothetical protein